MSSHNIERFPLDFMFQLNDKEKNELVVKCDRLNSMKHSTANPNVFTEVISIKQNITYTNRQVLDILC